eukprot:snap_masked-scaffold_22-processed-gene-0.21-mRNA-1 protein AED:1.00 eAED:1.00 QI:0/0/0/0/1/1/2/0/189
MKLHCLTILPFIVSATNFASSKISRESKTNALTNGVFFPRLDSLRQECEDVTNTTEIKICTQPGNLAIEERLLDLSPEDRTSVNNILFEYALNEENDVEELAKRLEDIVGPQFFCTPNILDNLPLSAFCLLKCEPGYCEKNREEVRASLDEIIGLFGCEPEIEDICEVFNEIAVVESNSGANILYMYVQ